jgi:hypothetical protein
VTEETPFREVWLHNAVGHVNALLLDAGIPKVPEARVSVGWPSKGGTSLKKRVIGQCWHAESTGDHVAQVFISPMLEDGLSVLSTLVHEMVHVCHPGSKHQGKFIETAKAVGLTPKWTATNAGEELTAQLEKINEELGKYPHSKITPIVQEKVQTTRMLKVECHTCGYIVRTTAKWLEVGLPSCPDGDEMEVEVK